MTAIVLMLALAQETVVAKVEAPDSVKLGEPLILDATGSIGEVMLWEACNIGEERYRLFSDGKVMAVWPETAGQLDFILFVAAGKKAETSRVKVMVTGTGEPPRPAPPSPPKTPSFGMDKKVLAWYRDIEGDEDHLEVAKIAATFVTVAGMVASGAFGDEPDMAKIAPVISNLNQAAIPEGRRDEWASKVLGKFANELSELITNGKLKTKQQYSALFTEVAKGLAQGAA